MAVDPAVSDAVLETSLRAVLEHHDALRLRYRRTDAGWEQWHADEDGITLERADLSGIAPGERDAAQEAIGGRWQTSLDLEHGPLGRAVLFDRGEEGCVLLLLLHHLLVDGVSWRILREDLDRACAQARRGLPVDLGPKSTSYREWAQALEAYAAGEALAQADFWLAQGADGVPALPADGEGEPGLGSSRHVTVRLEPEETRLLLQDVPAAYGAQINDVLLCALAQAVGAWTGGTRTRVALESHGRAEEVGPGLDLTRSVGWFTSIHPVVLDTAGAAGFAERVARIRAQLRAVPALGVGYGALRWLAPDGELRRALAAQPEPELVFNYLGQFDQDLAPGMDIRFAGGPKGLDIAEVNHRVYTLGVSGNVIAGRLALSWRYGEGVHRPETIERVANACLEALRSLIAHAAGRAPGG
jgi:non-ribosomal peptide synthase protein (TIGR01720 family)